MNQLILPNEVLLSREEAADIRNRITQIVSERLSARLLGRSWKLTRADVLAVDYFIKEMQYFANQHPLEYKQLCEAINGRSEVGVIGFHIDCSKEMSNLPKHFVGESLTVVYDAATNETLWEWSSLVSG